MIFHASSQGSHLQNPAPLSHWKVFKGTIGTTSHCWALKIETSWTRNKETTSKENMKIQLFELFNLKGIEFDGISAFQISQGHTQMIAKFFYASWMTPQLVSPPASPVRSADSAVKSLWRHLFSVQTSTSLGVAAEPQDSQVQRENHGFRSQPSLKAPIWIDDPSLQNRITARA